MPARATNPLHSIAEALAGMDASDRLETLAEFGVHVPELPLEYEQIRDAGIGVVRECQSPVFLLADVVDGRISIHADAPHEAPVARGFVGLLIHVFEGSSVDRLQAAPVQILDYLHLTPVLSMRRARGLHGIFMRLRSVLNSETAAVQGELHHGNS